MTPLEFTRLFEALATAYPVLGNLQTNATLQGVWIDSLENASADDVRTSLKQWISNNNRAPTVNDIALTALDIRRERIAAREIQAIDESWHRIKQEKVPVSQDNPDDDAWVRFHLHWTNRGINTTLLQLNDNRRAVPKFPWAELAKAYRDLAEKHPGLRADCEEAIAALDKPQED